MSERIQRTDRPAERLYNGFVRENPTFVLMLGMCPTLAVTTSAVNGLGMGLTTTAVLMLSNLIISCLRKVIPNRVRIPAFIVVIASFVTMVELLLEAYIPFLNKSLGVYIPLIVVNCIILGRAESYAYSHSPIASFFDGLGMGLGFSFALTCIGAVRELLGAGSLFNYTLLPEGFTPISIFGLAPGAFFVVAGLTALQNVLKERAGGKKSTVKKEKETLPAGCAQDCSACGVSGCSSHGRFYDDRAGKISDKTTGQSSLKTERQKSQKAVERMTKEVDRKNEKADTKSAKTLDVSSVEDELTIIELEKEDT